MEILTPFPISSFQDKKYRWQRTLSLLLYHRSHPIGFFFTKKNSQPWNLKLKLSRSGANIALHFVNPFIMRQPILIQFKMEKTNRALSPQRKSKKSHSGFNILATLMVARPKNIIFYGFPRTVLCFNQIIHCHSFWKEKSQYRISAPNLFTASYQLKKF